MLPPELKKGKERMLEDAWVRIVGLDGRIGEDERDV
jgi:hypothetical protein